jgi:phosphoglycerate kinase
MIRYLGSAGPDSLRGTALLRLDFNTEDDWRMRAVLPTIKFLLKKSSKVVIMSHRGRPQGVEKKFSLRKNAGQLSHLLKRQVIFISRLDFAKARAVIEAAPHGSVFLIENLRFSPAEEKNDPKFAKQLASLGDFYVNDAFAVDHRANASLVAITKFLPSYGGFELKREIEFLSRAMKNPKHPFVIIVGGGKAADKLDVLTYFKNKADYFLLGGGPGNTMLALRGFDVKKSTRDRDPKDIKSLKPFIKMSQVLTPVDFRWRMDAIDDIGPKTVALYASKIACAKTIFWGGPMGPIEKPARPVGSIAVAKAIAKNRRAFSISGGGETVTLLKQYHFDRKFTFISTGGGAMIDFLAGKKMPGIIALEQAGSKIKK